MEPARPAAVVGDFSGLATDVDPRDLTANTAEVQENLAVITLGEMTVRRGIREVFFDTE